MFVKCFLKLFYFISSIIVVNASSVIANVITIVAASIIVTIISLIVLSPFFSYRISYLFVDVNTFFKKMTV